MVPEDLRAILTFILNNLYVDKEPRCFISKPNYVRTFHNNSQNNQNQLMERFIEINLSDGLSLMKELKHWIVEHLTNIVEIAEKATI